MTSVSEEVPTKPPLPVTESPTEGPKEGPREGPGEKTLKTAYQDKYGADKVFFLVLLFFLLCILAFGILVLGFLLLKNQNPPPVYFVSSERGELITQKALDAPNMPNNELFNWVVESMMAAQTFNFINSERVLENAKQYFTIEGYDSFIKALNNALVISNVRNNKLVMRAQPILPPQITKEGVLANRYLWKIKVSMNFQYRNVTNFYFDKAEIILLVMRVPNEQSPVGIKILKYDLTINRNIEP